MPALLGHRGESRVILTSRIVPVGLHFLRTGLTDPDAEQLANALDSWTRSAMAALPEASRLLLQFLAYLEEDDRVGLVLKHNWADLWRRLERTGDPPALDEAITPVVRTALVHADRLDAADPASIRYRLHPGVTETVRTQAGPGLRDAVAWELAAYWSGTLQQAGSDGAENSELASHAGLAATHYLIQLGEWHQVGACLQAVRLRTNSPSTIQTLVQHLRRIAAATGTADDLAELGTALRFVDPQEAETLLRDSLRALETEGDFNGASVAAANLSTLLATTGQLPEALEMADLGFRYTVQAGLGPWTQLSCEDQRLRILGELGQHEQVLAELPELQRKMTELSDGTENENVEPWDVRELVRITGWQSAQALGRWEECLDLNEKIIESERGLR